MSISQINNYESKVQPVLRPALNLWELLFLKKYSMVFIFTLNDFTFQCKSSHIFKSEIG
ncbi:hypothetical protein LEP1GSC082_4564 [Leptospira kirschneri str. H2]|nr:hypothetical protein LEP1GSC082_4564 [Leptospira kirschneri str. H2]